MSRGTDRRTVRVAPELWERAGRAAACNGESVSDVIRRALEDYTTPELHDVLDLCSCGGGTQPFHVSH